LASFACAAPAKEESPSRLLVPLPQARPTVFTPLARPTIFTPSIPLAVGVLRVRRALARLTVFTPSSPPAVGVLRVHRACSLMQGS
jgi:hypothetical protein